MILMIYRFKWIEENERKLLQIWGMDIKWFSEVEGILKVIGKGISGFWLECFCGIEFSRERREDRYEIFN